MALPRIAGTVKTSAVFTDWPDMHKECVKAMRKQIQKEIYASTQYLAMAAYFSTDTVNRPGFAEHFFKAAKEEREHGSKLVEYLSMRGLLTDSVNDLITVPVSNRFKINSNVFDFIFVCLTDSFSLLKTVQAHKWTGLSALEDAFKLETEVTQSIRKLIKTCEGTARDSSDNDYHLVDYLTGVYLEEQLTGQRDLAGKISTLNKMMSSQGELGEFLFDKNNM